VAKPNRKKAPKPRKKSKPLSNRKAVQEQNRRLLDFFTDRLQESQKQLREFEERVAQSNQQLWDNQQKQNEGLSTAEEHVVLIRRVLNDALCGTTRVTTIERRSQSNPEEQEEVQVIDWGWYGEQLHYSDDPQTFMNGHVLTDEEVAERAQKERVKKQHNIVLYLAGKAAEKDEDKLREVYDAGGLEEHLQTFLPQKVVWEEEMAAMAPTIVDQVLKQREAARKQQKKMGEVKERALVKGAVAKVIAAGDEELLDDPTKKMELVMGALPAAISWTEGMESILDEVIIETKKAMAEKEAEREAMEKKAAGEEENDPEEVEAAKEELLRETKKFGEEAAGVIALIEAGKEDEAREAMAKLEQKVKDKEAEADRSGAPLIPDGAAVFGGS
jgi:hypothetical protein